jgi:hypothetical protein
MLEAHSRTPVPPSDPSIDPTHTAGTCVITRLLTTNSCVPNRPSITTVDLLLTASSTHLLEPLPAPLESSLQPPFLPKKSTFLSPRTHSPEPLSDYQATKRYGHEVIPIPHKLEGTQLTEPTRLPWPWTCLHTPFSNRRPSFPRFPAIASTWTLTPAAIAPQTPRYALNLIALPAELEIPRSAPVYSTH